jgi:hypothetical protein
MPDYEHYLKSAGVTRAQAVPALKKSFRLFTKSTLSMVCHPDDYGVQLTGDAERALVKAFGWQPGLSVAKRKAEARRQKPNRLYVRLDDAMSARLESYYSRSAFCSKQDLIEAAILLFLNRVEGVSV